MRPEQQDEGYDQGDSQVVERGGTDTLWFEYEVYGEESVHGVIASQRT